MESARNKNSKTGLVEEDVNLSAFRKRNNILVLILICFIISLILILGSSTFYIAHNSESDQPIPPNPAVRAYYSVACNTPSCLNIINPVVSTKSITNPNQIFTLFLQTAAQELKNLTSSMHSNSDTELVYKNCSDSLLDGFSQIRDALAAMRVNPFVERLSNEKMGEIMNRIITAEEDLKCCLDDLSKTESTAVNEVKEKVLRVKVYLNSGGDFLFMYDVVMQKFSSDIAANDWTNMVLENMVVVFACGLYIWFIFYFFRALCRFLGVKSLPLSNVFRAWHAGAPTWRR